jgi:S-adenosylmethionine:tRNA ribosyltransferase-isomerase
MSALPDPQIDDIDDRVAAYDYALDPSRIAQHPAEPREAARMAVVRVGSPTAWTGRVADLPAILAPGDVVVVNDARVLPARLHALRRGGGRVELLGLGPRPDGDWACFLRPASKCKPGSTLRVFARGNPAVLGPTLTVGEALPGGARRVRCADRFEAVLEQFGEMPLPPYIARPDGPEPADRERYQTLYAAEPGAAAAPTAGLHLGAGVLSALSARGVLRVAVTLRVSAATFVPVRSERLSEHPMHSEDYRVPPETAVAVREALDSGRRVLCIGTTALRSIESWHRAGEPADGGWRRTSLFLRPGNPPRLPVALLTNFHLPASTLLPLVASLGSREAALAHYREAAERGFRFYSYGDCTLHL